MLFYKSCEENQMKENKIKKRNISEQSSVMHYKCIAFAMNKSVPYSVASSAATHAPAEHLSDGQS